MRKAGEVARTPTTTPKVAECDHFIGRSNIVASSQGKGTKSTLFVTHICVTNKVDMVPLASEDDVVAELN